MTNSKSTKRALLSSAFAMLVCVAMLIGTTFAWFTDTASTGVNKIQAGNLDIGVEYTLDGEQWRDVEEATDLFGNEDALFEPGYTRVVAFRITNKGNLALKYKMSMNLVDEKKGINKDGLEFALSDYLKVKTSPLQEVNQFGDLMVSIAFNRSTSKAIGWTEADFKDFGIVAEDQILSAGQQIYSIMQVYMPESVGNEANAKDIESAPSINFGINVVATQATVEKDSFDNKYDKDAAYPAVDQTELTALLNSGKIVTLGKDIAPTDTITVSEVKSTLDLNGKKMENDAEIWSEAENKWSLVSARDGANLTITGNGTFAAKANDCFAVDVQDGSTVTIKNGTFIGNIHAVYVEEGTAIIEGGFYSVQQKYTDPAKADEFVLNCYDANRANGTAKIIVTGGTFVNFNPADCWAEGEHTNFVADGYKVVSEVHGTDTWYTVVAE